MTNFERIKLMSVEELAVLMQAARKNEICDFCVMKGKIEKAKYCDILNVEVIFKDWLESEVSE